MDATVVINNREYKRIEFTREELEAGAAEQYGDFDLSDLAREGVTEAEFWEGVAAQLTLDRNRGAHPPYGFRFEARPAVTVDAAEARA